MKTEVFDKMAPKMKVPFGTLTVTPQAERLIAEAVASRRLTSGRYVREFEERFAALVGAREAVAVSSGGDADALALAVLYDFGAQRGDEIIIPSLSFVATGNSVLQAGFTPVFADIRRATLNINPELIEAAVTERTRAVMPVHLMGKPAEMAAIRAIAARHKLVVIEDAAEAHGALLDGKPAGSLGDMAAFSLYAAHIISSVEGGIVTTDNAEYAGVLRSLRAHGRACACRVCSLSTTQNHCPHRFEQDGADVRFRFDRVGFSAKMNELEAAVGLGNLDIYEDTVRRRHDNLIQLIRGFDAFRDSLETIHEEPGEFIGPHAFPIIVREGMPFTRNDITQHLEQNGIETRTLFASMPTQCPGFAWLGHRLGEFPVAEYMGLHGLHIGVHQDLGALEMEYVLDTIDAFLRRYH